MEGSRPNHLSLICTKGAILLITFLAIRLAGAQDTVTLLFAGDAMQHQSQLDNASRNGAYDYSSYFKHIRSEISAADIAVVNLELTLGGPPFRGYPQFSAPDAFASALKEAGFNVFLNANNHILDRGNRGLIRTLDVLDSLLITHTGVFRSEDERQLLSPLMFAWNNVRFAILNYTYGTNGIAPEQPVAVNYIDPRQIRADVRKARSLNADIIIANIHWGDEYSLLQNVRQDELADFMINEGIDIIMGSHPHVVQPSRTITDYRGDITGVVVYSLGNFVSGMTAPNTYGGQLVRIRVEKEPFRRARISSAEYALVYVHREPAGGKVDFVLLPVSMAERSEDPQAGAPAIALGQEAYKRMMRFTDTARELFNRYNTGFAEYRPGILRRDTGSTVDFYARIFGD
ncbi:MAG: CapA family protein [Tannerellaceae bacterium]|jgi:poly-gamma-glutamate synthesis protein (capsule biosynthesis protein)|nr:CapA family protein [Tannerellaceae bacterium]